jgi:hypothetical protein
MGGTPYFRCRYARPPHLVGGASHLIYGRLEVRRPSLQSPAVSGFSRPTLFKVDTGAVETAVDDTFAAAHGFGDFRQIGQPITASGFDASARPLPAWRVYRWVRFRDHRDGLRGRPGEPGGIPLLEFRIAFIIVTNVTIPLPLFGLRDMHNYFTVGSAGDEYTFIARGTAGSWPTATDGGQGVREIP